MAGLGRMLLLLWFAFLIAVLVRGGSERIWMVVPCVMLLIVLWVTRVVVDCRNMGEFFAALVSFGHCREEARTLYASVCIICCHNVLSSVRYLRENNLEEKMQDVDSSFQRSRCPYYYAPASFPVAVLSHRTRYANQICIHARGLDVSSLFPLNILSYAVGFLLSPVASL